MAGYKASTTNPKSNNWKRYIGENEIKPSMYYGAKGKMLCGSINGELIMDENNQPIPFASIKHTSIGIASK
jgi:hypothetical protein